MARLNFLVALLRREAAYTTYANPDPAVPADVVIFRDVAVEAANADIVERPRLLPFHGYTGSHNLVRRRLELSGTVPLATSGVVATPPPVGKILRACGMAETITPGARVLYTPVSGGHEAYSLGYFLDGTRHRGMGMRGTFSITMEAGEEPQMAVNLMSAAADDAAAALPVASYTAWRDPLPVQGDLTTFFLGGHHLPLQRLVYTHGNTLVRRDMPGLQDARISGRQPRLEVTLQAPDGLNPFNFFSLFRAPREMFATLRHGINPGDMLYLHWPRIRPEPGLRYGADGDVAMLTMTFRCMPSVAGDDEIEMHFF